jgi:hypothetical protein
MPLVARFGPVESETLRGTPLHKETSDAPLNKMRQFLVVASAASCRGPGGNALKPVSSSFRPLAFFCRLQLHFSSSLFYFSDVDRRRRRPSRVRESSELPYNRTVEKSGSFSIYFQIGFSVDIPQPQEHEQRHGHI